MTGEPIDDFKLALDQAREGVTEAEKRLRYAKENYAKAWSEYEAEKIRLDETMQVTVKSYSHLLEGGLVVERRARFCDMSGEEIAEGSGAKVVITKGESRWEADLSAASLTTILETLNDPEEKKKRGRPTGDAAKPAETEQAKEPAAAK